MSTSRSFLVRMLAAAGLIVGFVACEKTDTTVSEKGPAEKAGQQLDQAASRASEELNKAAGVAGKGLQQLGQKIQGEAEQAEQSQQKKE